MLMSTAGGGGMGARLIRVGTTGWSHASWVGTFYPVSLKDAPEEWLAFYATRFRSVEVASTFDAFPSPDLVHAWARVGVEVQERLAAAPSHVDGQGLLGLGDAPFEFSLKAPRALTHEALLEGDAARARAVAGRFDREVLDPLAGEGLLGAVLLQLPPRLEASEQAVSDLQEVVAALAERRIAIEFRHPSWSRGGCVAPEAEPLFANPDVCLVQADGAGIPEVAPPTRARHAYVRFHGRRPEGWAGALPEDAPRDGARYDHRYAPAELAPWVARVRAMREARQEVRVHFNNAPGGKAPVNALEFLAALGLAPPGRPPRLTQQTRLHV